MADDFAKEVREQLADAEEADRDNREEAITDLKFEAGDQWNDSVRHQRESKSLPCLTVNTAQQYTGQVVGDYRANETSIKVMPREGGDKAIAEVRSELIRSIELQSKASRVYASSLGQMVACGISNFRVVIEDAIENPFLRDIFIRDIPNPLAVWWDPLSFDPTGRDATYCFVGDEMSAAEYKRRFKGAALPSLISREAGSNWSDGKIVQVPEYWKIEERPRTFGMTVSGKTVDLTDIDRKKWPQLAIDPETKQSIVREKVPCKYAVSVLTNGMEPLTDPYEVKVHRLPIIRVMGREGLNDGKRVRFGLIRFMRDSILMRNHNRSIRAELLMKFPRVNFIGPASAIEGLEGDWTSYLGFNDGAQMPVEVTGRNLGALIAEDQIYTQDLRDVTGIHEASLGMPSNETSGVAIRARQQEGDVATIIYHDNMLAAQQEAGEVVNAYIPTVFDTARTIRTVGPDLGVKLIRINDPDHPENIDIGVGTYDVTISTGPAYATRRQEATAQLMELASQSPKIVDVAADLIVGEMDLVNGDKLQERLKRAMPPQILGDDANDDKSPEEQAADQAKAQKAEQVQEMGMQLEMQSKQADTALKVAQARKAAADAEKSEAEALKAKAEAMQAIQGGDGEAASRLEIEGYNAITNRLKAVGAVTPDSPPSLEEHLAPIVAQLVGEALKQHFGIGATEPSQDGVTA